jgi:methylated-DNA-[protein]-cysteine S-methyltransferase
MRTVAEMLNYCASAPIAVTTLESPVGDLLVASTEKGVYGLTFDDRVESLEPRLRRSFGHFFHFEVGDPLDVAQSLRGYFAGTLAALDGIPLAFTGTPMQQRVWDIVRALHPGELTTYSSIAERLGMPRGHRAIAACLAANPAPLFIPCQRVVTASGGLGSHPAGTARKRWLLSHEGVLDAGELSIAARCAAASPRTNAA